MSQRLASSSDPNTATARSNRYFARRVFSVSSEISLVLREAMVRGERPSFLASSACARPIFFAVWAKASAGAPSRMSEICTIAGEVTPAWALAVAIFACLIPGYGRGVSTNCPLVIGLIFGVLLFDGTLRRAQCNLSNCPSRVDQKGSFDGRGNKVR